jgi:hypothetical protein
MFLSRFASWGQKIGSPELSKARTRVKLRMCFVVRIGPFLEKGVDEA